MSMQANLEHINLIDHDEKPIEGQELMLELA